MKPGRNDPCPCGSGKKYKHCCLMADQTPAPQDLAWRRVRRVLEGFPARLLRFIKQTYGDVAVPEAWEEFTGWSEAPFDPQGPQIPVFMPWMFHHWYPDPDQDTLVDARLHKISPTRALLDREGPRLDPALREYLESCLTRPFSFYEVSECRPGSGFTLCDVFNGETHEVLDRSASTLVQAGDLIFALLARAQGVTLLEATGSVVIPPFEKIELINRRTRMRRAGELTPARLRRYDIELREAYLDISDRLLNPAPPRLQTTDGEDLVLQKLVFDIESPQAALDALRHLDFELSADEQLQDAERDAQGALKRVSITWKKPGNAKHKSWSNTILGGIEIDGRRMNVEVKSQERADRFRQIVAESLGDKARFRAAQVQSADKLLAEAQAGGPSPSAEDRAFQNSPEAQALIREHLARHYENWPTQKIPALGNRTPLAAVKTADGREKVEALLRDFERHSGSRPPGEAEVFQNLRERLGLSQAGAQ